MYDSFTISSFEMYTGFLMATNPLGQSGIIFRSLFILCFKCFIFGLVLLQFFVLCFDFCPFLLDWDYFQKLSKLRKRSQKLWKLAKFHSTDCENRALWELSKVTGISSPVEICMSQHQTKHQSQSSLNTSDTMLSLTVEVHLWTTEQGTPMCQSACWKIFPWAQVAKQCKLGSSGTRDTVQGRSVFFHPLLQCKSVFLNVKFLRAMTLRIIWNLAFWAKEIYFFLRSDLYRHGPLPL